MKIYSNGEMLEVPGEGVTMEQVNDAINAAITGAMEEAY